MGGPRRTRWGRRPRATECVRDPGAMNEKPGRCLLRGPRSECWNHRGPSSVALAATAAVSDAECRQNAGRKAASGVRGWGRAGNHDARQQSLWIRVHQHTSSRQHSSVPLHLPTGDSLVLLSGHTVTFADQAIAKLWLATRQG